MAFWIIFIYLIALLIVCGCLIPLFFFLDDPQLQSWSSLVNINLRFPQNQKLSELTKIQVGSKTRSYFQVQEAAFSFVKKEEVKIKFSDNHSLKNQEIVLIVEYL